MQCINYAKREQEKPLLFKLTLRSRFQGVYKTRKGPEHTPDGMDPPKHP